MCSRARSSCLTGEYSADSPGEMCVLVGRWVWCWSSSNGFFFSFRYAPRPVESALTLTSPVFREGVLKVFRNTITNDLRFHCRIDRESETYWSTDYELSFLPFSFYSSRPLLLGGCTDSLVFCLFPGV